MMMIPGPAQRGRTHAAGAECGGGRHEHPARVGRCAVRARLTAGGIFFPDAWYDACDEQGVLVYHDMQYAQEGHSPANDTTQVPALPLPLLSISFALVLFGQLTDRLVSYVIRSGG